MNLEKLFEKYLRAYFAAHPEVLSDPEEVLPTVYAEWSDKPEKELGGVTPRAYVNKLTDAKELIAMAAESIISGGEPSPLVVDRIVALPKAESDLVVVLDGEYDERMRALAVELLSRMDKLPVRLSLELVFDPSTPEILREALIDRLKYTDNVGTALLDRIGTTDGEAKKILAELLVGSGVKDDKVFSLLLELLNNGDCLPYATQLLAEYGDERAIEPLSTLAETAVYADYIELRNAVEMLGGDLTLRFNFENDPTYQKIKN